MDRAADDAVVLEHSQSRAPPGTKFTGDVSDYSSKDGTQEMTNCECRRGCGPSCACRKIGWPCGLVCSCMDCEGSTKPCGSPFTRIAENLGGVKRERFLDEVKGSGRIAIAYLAANSRCEWLPKASASACLSNHLNTRGNELDVEDLQRKMMEAGETARIREAGDVYLLSMMDLINEAQAEKDEEAKANLLKELFRYACGREHYDPNPEMAMPHALTSRGSMRWSFCRDTWVSRHNIAHCWKCNECLEDSWHCNECGVCKIGRDYPCDRCGGWCKGTKDFDVGSAVAKDAKPTPKTAEESLKRSRRSTGAGEASSSSAGKRRAQ
ncbi:Hypothetical predicted protein [Lecanosticta acicola]|uniref:Tesmin/TSO1-like CXC domain-containing protein n=1 Tax=Lecanosticta acicola TaxID=111012 RepID=A0AAI8VVR6_9PEZI|nr:Hypothetical predicted protein [Lecanosticta acicola]